MTRRLNGWLRLWIVGSLVLLIIMGWSLYLTLAIADDAYRIGHVRDYAVAYLLSVFGVLLAGYAIAWIARGFGAAPVKRDGGAPP